MRMSGLTPTIAASLKAFCGGALAVRKTFGDTLVSSRKPNCDAPAASRLHRQLIAGEVDAAATVAQHHPEMNRARGGVGLPAVVGWALQRRLSPPAASLLERATLVQPRAARAHALR